MKVGLGQIRRVVGEGQSGGLKIGGIDLMGAVVSGAEFLQPRGRDVESDDGKPGAPEGDRNGQAHVTQADYGNAAFRHIQALNPFAPLKQLGSALIHQPLRLPRTAARPPTNDRTLNMPSGSKTAIVISSDANYFDLLMGTVRSLQDRAPGVGADICILDVGLTADQVAILKDMAASVVTVGWDMDFPGRDHTPGYFKAMVSRPYLPAHFPGYETYMWIDSDAWVQDPSVISLFLDAAASGALAIVPEIDRGYSAHYKRPRPYWRRPSHRMYRWAYGWKVADRLGRVIIGNDEGQQRIGLEPSVRSGSPGR